MWRNNAELEELAESVVGVVEPCFDHLSVGFTERLVGFAIGEEGKRRVGLKNVVGRITGRRKEVEWVKRGNCERRRIRERHHSFMILIASNGYLNYPPKLLRGPYWASYEYFI